MIPGYWTRMMVANKITNTRKPYDPAAEKPVIKDWFMFINYSLLAGIFALIGIIIYGIAKIF